jgi:hypothetical protein
MTASGSHVHGRTECNLFLRAPERTFVSAGRTTGTCSDSTGERLAVPAERGEKVEKVVGGAPVSPPSKLRPRCSCVYPTADTRRWGGQGYGTMCRAGELGNAQERALSTRGGPDLPACRGRRTASAKESSARGASMLQHWTDSSDFPPPAAPTASNGRYFTTARQRVGADCGGSLLRHVLILTAPGEQLTAGTTTDATTCSACLAAVMFLARYTAACPLHPTPRGDLPRVSAAAATCLPTSARPPRSRRPSPCLAPEGRRP